MKRPLETADGDDDMVVSAPFHSRAYGRRRPAADPARGRVRADARQAANGRAAEPPGRPAGAARERAGAGTGRRAGPTESRTFPPPPPEAWGRGERPPVAARTAAHGSGDGRR